MRDEYLSQLDRNGHAWRTGDLERFASLGIKALRYPVLWERTAPCGLAAADWSWPDERLARLRELSVEPIVGLMHHGSGPPDTHLLDPEMAPALARYAAAVARRYPWVRCFTPVNEPLTTARFSALYGLWYPHRRSDAAFARALVNQCRAVVLAMQAIRRVTPHARLIQTEDLGRTFSTPALRAVAAFYNERRWLTWDLLCGRVQPGHAMWEYLQRSGIAGDELRWFQDHRCPPDLLGANYYVTGERWLDERLERYPRQHWGDTATNRLADIEAARALATPIAGIGPLLREAGRRYGLPLAVTEVHIDSHREDQLRWLHEIWCAAQDERRQGTDVRAVTLWSLLGSYDWNTLVTCSRGYYEPSAFDVRSQVPRPTALARLARQLACGETPTHPVLAGDGWWRRSDRFWCPPVQPSEVADPGPDADRRGGTTGATPQPRRRTVAAAPVLILGARGTLGRAFERLCRQRGLACRALARADLDIGDAAAVAREIAQARPWAVVNACGFTRVDRAEAQHEACFRANAHGAAVVAGQCAHAGVQLLSFSSHLVFDGRQSRPYVETDAVAPLSAYGRSKAEAERRVQQRHPQALLVRTSPFFSPWDEQNFLFRGLARLACGEDVLAADDTTISPTYVPDLVHACLDLLVDQESGIWHLSNGQPATWAQLLRWAAERAGVAHGRLHGVAGPPPVGAAPRPRYSVLGSDRATLMPGLEAALDHFCSQLPPHLLDRARPATCPAAPAQPIEALP